MGNIIKRVDRNIPLTQRMQVFTKDDATIGDVLMVETSLGYQGRFAEITSKNGSMAVRFNVYQTVYPRRPAYEGMNADMYYFLASGIEYTIDTPRIEIGSNTIVTINNLPIRDIEIITASGTEFSVLVK